MTTTTENLAAALREACDHIENTMHIVGGQNVAYEGREALAAYDAEQRATPALADALRRMIDTDTGGKNYSGQIVHADAIRDGIAALAALEAQPAAPAMLDTQAAVTSVADDYVAQRHDPNDEKRSLSDLVDEAINHACSVLGAVLDEDASDTIHEELTDRYTTTTDDDRSNGPRQ